MVGNHSRIIRNLQRRPYLGNIPRKEIFLRDRTKTGMIIWKPLCTGYRISIMENINEPEILIEEEAPRDGIQNESRPFSLQERIALIDALSLCGFRRIQIGSFVHPRWVPQMADTEKVFERIQKHPGVTYPVLLLNEKGLERAFSCRVGEVAIFASASETHSRKNSNCTVKEAASLVSALIRRAKAGGMRVRAGVMNAFGCRYEGAIPPERVLGIVRLFAESGADEISLADTAGIAHPRQMEEILPRATDITDLPLSLHLHDTYGFGLANVYAAWKIGVKRFDGCCGGLGGCPFIPGAAGNIPTEDMVHLFESMGISTGVSLEKLARVVRDLETLLGRRLPGRYVRTFCEAGG